MMMDTLKYSYNTYKYSAYVVPLLVLGFSLIGVFVAAYTIILVSWPFKKMAKLADKEISPRLMADLRGAGKKIPCWTCIFGGLKLVYGHQIDEVVHPYPNQTNIYSICGRHVQPCLLVILFLVVVFVCNCTVVSFWSEFLIDESAQCDRHMDCFAFNNWGEIVQQEPLDNCTEYELESYDIHCFRFSFDYADALGNAGGVMILASVVMNIQAGLWIGATSQQRKCLWYLAVVGVITMNIIIEAVLIAILIMVQFVPLFRTRITSSDRSSVQFYTYWATFLCAFTISGPIFIVFSKRLRRDIMVDREEQRHLSINSKAMRMGNSAGNISSELDCELN